MSASTSILSWRCILLTKQKSCNSLYKWTTRLYNIGVGVQYATISTLFSTSLAPSIAVLLQLILFFTSPGRVSSFVVLHYFLKFSFELFFSKIIFNAFVKLSLNKYLTITLTNTKTSNIPPVINILKVVSE